MKRRNRQGPTISIIDAIAISRHARLGNTNELARLAQQFKFGSIESMVEHAANLRAQKRPNN